MDQEAESRENLSHLKLQLYQSLPLLRERFLEQLIGGTLNEAKIMERLDYFGLGLTAPNYLVVAIDIDDLDEMSKEKWHHDPELFRSSGL